MYRAVALAVIEQNINPHDSTSVADIARRADIRLEGDPYSLKIYFNGQDVSDRIRTEQVGSVASIISAIPEVRRALVQRQRDLGVRGSVVLDGRDVGTVVFPNANFKFFLTAAPEARAKRRFEEERIKSQNITFEETLSDINLRDLRDTTRADSPLMIADDAIVIDSTELSINEALKQMLSLIEDKHLNNKSASG
jgi:CMP/dCMP kinase